MPLSRGDNGEVIIPTPAEIAEMKANGEGEWVELLERPVPPAQTEEEWRMQETLRQRGKRQASKNNLWKNLPGNANKNTN